MKWIVLTALTLSFSSAFAVSDIVKKTNLDKPTSPALKNIEDPSGFIPIGYDPDKLNQDKPTSPSAVEDGAGFVRIDYRGQLELGAD